MKNEDCAYLTFEEIGHQLAKAKREGAREAYLRLGRWITDKEENPVTPSAELIRLKMATLEVEHYAEPKGGE